MSDATAAPSRKSAGAGTRSHSVRRLEKSASTKAPPTRSTMCPKLLTSIIGPAYPAAPRAPPAAAGLRLRRGLGLRRHPHLRAAPARERVAQGQAQAPAAPEGAARAPHGRVGGGGRPPRALAALAAHARARAPRALGRRARAGRGRALPRRPGVGARRHGDD